MSKLICDICGTSYSEGVEKCPTCGYSRAFEESGPDAARPVVREKVRGGRFSKKNVRKRLELLAKTSHAPQEPVPAAEIGEELGAAVASVTAAQQMQPAPEMQPAAEAAEQTAVSAGEEMEAVQQPEPVLILLPEEEPSVQEAAEEPAPVEEPLIIVLPDEEAPVQEAAEEAVEVPAPVEEPLIIVLPDEVAPVQEAAEEAVEEPAPVEEPLVIVLPDEEAPVQEAAEEAVEVPAPVEEPLVIVLPDEVAPVQEAVEEAVEEPAPVEEPLIIVLPEAEAPAQEEAAIPAAPVAVPDPEPEEEEKKKKKGGCFLRIVLFTALAALLAAAAYLAVTFGIPYLQNMDWPTQPVAETTVPTEEPTQAPTDAPTEAPTDPPTEVPTDPPTEPPTQAPTAPPTEAPTEAPTEPLLDVKLELNYYDLTFGATNQATQLKANIIPNEDITWISEDPSVATVSDTGNVVPVSGGKTTVRAIYGGQEVTVKINCAF